MTAKAASKPDWKSTTATVTSVEPRHGISQTLETEDNPGRDYYIIHFRYMADGQTYGGNFESRISYPPEDTFEILYNPANPEQTTKSGAVPTHKSRTNFALLLAIVVVVLTFIAFILFRH
jgi:hypothetical protein